MAVASRFPEVESPDQTLPQFVLDSAVALGDEAALADGVSGRTLTYADLPAGPAPITDRGWESGFVGRRTELAAARALLRDRAAGLSLLVVSGEPGIGKSRFLAEVRGLAEDQGWRVAVGQATRCEREVSFAVFGDALTPLVLAEPAVIDRLPAHLADGLADVLPVVRAASDSSLAGRRHRATPRRGHCWSSSARDEACCSYSMTCTGPTRRPPSSSIT